MAVPAVVRAAGNPSVDTLAHGSVVQFSGKEAVSEPFVFDVTIATNDRALNFALVVGQPITMTVAPGRVVSGMIESIEQLDVTGAQGLYRIKLVPSVNRLTFRTASRTFYNMKIIDIVMAVTNAAGVSNVEARVNVNPMREITFQHRETDLAFVSRLLEEAGIHYHFEPSPGGDKLVLSDGNAGFPLLPAGKLVFSATATPAVTSFARGQSVHSGQVQAGDYNWKTPTADLSAAAQTSQFGDLTERRFPAGVETKAEAQAEANIRLAARVADAQVCRGESTYPQLQAGHRVVLTAHPRADFNQEYVILEVEHRRTPKEYRNTFRCLPVQVVYRPLLITPQPIVSSVVSGIVVGPPGETKHVDQFGRVKVKFPWKGPATESADSGFVRVAQIAAGVGSTAMWLPDVGDEVLVAFEHGDPGRPVVIGSLYNGKDMPPAALPANKHLSILRAQSASGAKSELVYDATSGNERLMMQSGNQVLTLGATSGVTVQASSVAVSASGPVQFQAGGDLVQQAGRNMAMEVGKDIALKAGQTFSLQSQLNTQLSVGGDMSIQTGKSLVTQSGAMFRFVAAQTGTIEARAGLFLKSPTQVSIEGADIAVKSSGNLTLKGAKISQN
jgi:type VI secretion system secreted protein VgrG